MIRSDLIGGLQWYRQKIEHFLRQSLIQSKAPTLFTREGWVRQRPCRRGAYREQSLVMRIKESHHFYSIQVQGGMARVDEEAVDIEAVVSYPEDLAQWTGEGRSASEIFQSLFWKPFIPQCHLELSQLQRKSHAWSQCFMVWALFRG